MTGGAAGTDPTAALDRFRAGYGFAFDDFQVAACTALQAGSGVLVAAPTGSGKTVVGEFAVHLALEQGRKCFYTTPIKALSNQKYRDLVARHGAPAVGLLTGDTTINGEAPVVVMTTEVLRNMLYAGSPTLGGLGYVVMDEVHYLADRFRGPVWEEVIINLPPSVAVVSLSATVSNAEEFGDWLDTVRGTTEVVVEERRPVPLWQHVMVGPRLLDLFVDAGGKRLNPQVVQVTRDAERAARIGGDRGGGDRRRGGRRPAGAATPGRVEVLDRLARADLLPAITFVFSRAGCDAAVLQCLRAGVRLTTSEERQRIRAHVESRTGTLPEDDLQVLGWSDWVDGLERGLAAHHAGLLPAFKEVVEELFTAGLVKAVFATETLALGINMPARCVVLERLVKWNGETHADVTPGEYTQLTGRAGRRGIDVEGHAVVLWQPGLDAEAVAGLATTRTYPLRSSFRPSYNMAVNLVGQLGRARARGVLESSFAQFQADRAVVGLSRQLRRQEEAAHGYHEAMACDRGDFAEYFGLRLAIAAREAELARHRGAARRASALQALEVLRPGDVVRVPAGRNAGLAVVLDPGLRGGVEPEPRPQVLTAGRQVRRLSLVDFPTPVQPLARVRVPRSFNARAAAARRDLSAAMHAALAAAEIDRDGSAAVETDTTRRRARGRPAGDDDGELARLRAALRAHPCHGCPQRDDHARWAERASRLDRDIRQLSRRVEGRTSSIARQLDLVCGLLDDVGYLEGDRVTPAGRRLAVLYCELDLLAAESLRAGLWAGLDPAELAAVVSALTFESRRPDDLGEPRLPPGRVREVLAETVRLWGDLRALEQDRGLSSLREPDLGFAWPAWRWARGHRLEAVLTDADLTAGDFVRAVKQLVDLLDQVAAAAAGDPLGHTARAAARALLRGVVAYSGVS